MLLGSKFANLLHQQQMHRNPNDEEEALMDVILFSGLENIQLAQIPLTSSSRVVGPLS